MKTPCEGRRRAKGRLDRDDHVTILPPDFPAVIGNVKYPRHKSKPTTLRRHQRTQLTQKKIISQEDNIDDYSK
jgi:hypothetical protein